MVLISRLVMLFVSVLLGSSVGGAEHSLTVSVQTEVATDVHLAASAGS